MYLQKHEFMKWIVYILLFLAGMNFVNRYFFCFYFAFAALLLWKKGKNIRIDGTTVPLLLFAISMLIFSTLYNGSLLGILKPFTFLFCYLIGLNVCEANCNSEEKGDDLTMLCILASSGMLVHFFLNAYMNRGYVADVFRNMNDVWTREALAATGQSSIAAIGIGLCVAMLFQTDKARNRIISAICLMGIFAYNLMLGGRTIIVLMAIEVFVSFFFLLLQPGDARKKRGYIIGFTLVAIAIYIVVAFNIGGIWEKFENSTFYLRFFSGETDQDLTSDGRMGFKQQYLQNLLNYPWGGNRIRDAIGNHYAHDLLLDTYSLGGVCSCLPLMVFIIKTCYYAVKVVLSKSVNLFVRTMTMCVYIAFTLIFFMEPILEGMPWLLAAYCLISGAVANLYRSILYR